LLVPPAAKFLHSAYNMATPSCMPLVNFLPLEVNRTILGDGQTDPHDDAPKNSSLSPAVTIKPLLV